MYITEYCEDRDREDREKTKMWVGRRDRQTAGRERNKWIDIL
jgi:hypothetical protein